GFKAFYPCQTVGTLNRKEGLAPLEVINRLLALNFRETVRFDLPGEFDSLVSLALEDQPNQTAHPPTKRFVRTSQLADLPIERPPAQPVVKLVQPGTEQKHQMAQQVTCNQKSHPAFWALESLYSRIGPGYAFEANP